MILRAGVLPALIVATAISFCGCKTKRYPTPEKNTLSAEQQREAVSRAAESSRLASAHAHYIEGVLHELNNETEQALEEFRRAVEEDPNDATLVLEVSRRFLQNKQPEKALEILRLATSRPGASGEVFAREGLVLAQLGRNDEALVANRTAIKKSPDSITGYQNLVSYYLKNNRPDDALKTIDEAARRPKSDSEFLIALGDLYRAYAMQFPTQRDAVNDKVAAVFTRAEEQHPKSPLTRLRLADGLYSVGKAENAAQLYLGLLGEFEDNPVLLEGVRARLADIYLRSDNSKLAREQLEAIVRSDPLNAQAYYFLGSISFDERNWTNAVEYFKKTILFKPDFEQAYYDLATAQLAADNPEDASETLRSAKSKFTTKFVTEYLMAMASQASKNFADAVTHFTAAEVIARAGDTKALNANFYFQSGIAHERNGDREQAAKLFEKALELQPDFPEAQNYLGYMWAERGENLDRAKELIEKALKAEPESAAYLDSMGWVLFKQNQPKPALEYLLKAIEHSEKPDATLYDHLGDIYAALNESAKARDAWEKSLALEANAEVRKKLESEKTP